MRMRFERKYRPMPFICTYSLGEFYREVKHSIKCLLGIDPR